MGDLRCDLNSSLVIEMGDLPNRYPFDPHQLGTDRHGGDCQSDADQRCSAKSHDEFHNRESYQNLTPAAGGLSVTDVAVACEGGLMLVNGSGGVSSLIFARISARPANASLWPPNQGSGPTDIHTCLKQLRNRVHSRLRPQSYIQSRLFVGQPVLWVPNPVLLQLDFRRTLCVCERKLAHFLVAGALGTFYAALRNPPVDGCSLSNCWGDYRLQSQQ